MSARLFGLEATYHKPAGSRWTDEQWAAIAADGSNLLVAAAAGSGKTAVLVERIISRIADEERPLDVDALLVATFTKAAAAEMKERIRIALEEALDKSPESAHLKRQLALLPRASVTTLHSFCMEVIEKYAPLIGLDPGLRIANETEAELMRMDTLDEVFEERYAEEGEAGPLARLADRFGGERSDELLHRLVLELHDFSRSHPWPEWWLAETAARFNVADADALAVTDWAESMRADVTLSLEGAYQVLTTARDLAESPGGPLPYATTLADDAAVVAALLETVRSGDWSTWNAAFAAAVFGRLKPCRGDGYDAGLQERVKSLRDDAKKTVARLAEEWFVRTPEQYAAELRALAPDMAALAELAASFGERYEKAKREKGLLDFGDLEHYALRILRDPASSPEHSLPSAAALDYRGRFAEILLDEYQDTNEVQEAIVSLIAKDAPGNVFMVGDVKQSIYRFRLAEPGLFMAKYKRYDVWTPEGLLRGGAEAAPGDASGADNGAGADAKGADAASAAGAAGGIRIDLARNFRSRPRVIDAVNRVFRLIMREKVGEMDYDLRAELIYGEGYPAESAGAAGTADAIGATGVADATGATGVAEAAGTASVSADVASTPETAGKAGAAGNAGMAAATESATRAASPYAVEMILLQSGAAGAGQTGSGGETGTEAAGDGGAQTSGATEDSEEQELETVQLEARCIAAEIKRLMGQDGSGAKPFAVYDGKAKLYRPLAYRDIVILLRAATSLSPAMLDELKLAGIPAYADLATGYFAATEVDVMLSLLHLIDNPDQDIPLAGVLRSPLVGLSAEQLARVRLHARRDSFWRAVRVAAELETEEALATTLNAFLRALSSWRSLARREPLGELLTTLYRETGYYDFVGGLPGGVQRQANLRALVDRARQFERNASSRGLFRFLRFLGRMRDTGSDLGAARALGEQEDVVRIVSIHKSKGLEFPVVFVAGLGRGFNKMDLNGLFLKHKKLGFGPKYIEADTRVAYPTLAQLAIRRRLKAEMLAEEMRVLYVALTRPKEKLILIGTTKDADKELAKWDELAEASSAGGGLPDYAVAAANRYLDWLGPAATIYGSGWVREGEAAAGPSAGEAVEARQAAGGKAAACPASAADANAGLSADIGADAAAKAGRASPEGAAPLWSCRVLDASAFRRAASAVPLPSGEEERLWQSVLALEPVQTAESEAGRAAYAALSWTDPYAAASRLPAKTSITALKRQWAEAGGVAARPGGAEAVWDDGAKTDGAEAAWDEGAGTDEDGVEAGGVAARHGGAEIGEDEAEAAWEEESRYDAGVTDGAAAADAAASSLTYRLRRPKFLSTKQLTPAERGTVVHLVMQHLPLQAGTGVAEVEALLGRLAERRILSDEQRRAVKADEIAAFCASPLYERMCAADKVWREVPFSYGIPARSAYPSALAVGVEEEPVLIQGVIDCLFSEPDGLVLVDYKTDRVRGDAWGGAAEKHRFQIERYAEAIGDILGRKVKEGYVYFVEGGQSVRLI